MDRTEVISSCGNPSFSKVFTLDFYFEERQRLRFELFDIYSGGLYGVKHEAFLGFVECNLGQVSRLSQTLHQRGYARSVLKVPTSANIRTSRCTQFEDSEKPNDSKTSLWLNPVKHLHHLGKVGTNSAVNGRVCMKSVFLFSGTAVKQSDSCLHLLFSVTANSSRRKVFKES